MVVCQPGVFGLRLALATLACAVMTMIAFAPPGHAVVPVGFDDQVLVNQTADFRNPTAFAATPDGRILVASQLGKLMVYKNGAVNPTPAIDLSGRICTEVERGLGGVGVDPAFADSHYVFLY